MQEKALNYSDIYLVPKYSELTSRADADVSVDFLGRKYRLPVIPANMSSVISEDNAKWLSQNDYFYIFHRFGDNRKFLQRTRAEAWKLVSISVGVKGEDREFIADIANSKCRIDYITIDIANGHSILMKNMIGHIKEELPNVKIIAGNVCTPEAVADLASWGADAAKVGIAGGGACSTKNMTGFHIPMFSCVRKSCYGKLYALSSGGFPIETKRNLIPVIADGGVRENGDIAKALVAGATMVMGGTIFAACKDAPGENIYKNAKTNISDVGFHDYKGEITHKCYYGSASAKQKGARKNVEGFEIEIPCNGLTYAEKYQEITESLQSSISYAGGKNLEALKQVNYITVK